MIHHMISSDETVSCIVCGATYDTDRYDNGDADVRCSGRTDLVHGYDCSSHSLDNCHSFDFAGECHHLATLNGCDCDACR